MEAVFCRNVEEEEDTGRNVWSSMEKVSLMNCKRTLNFLSFTANTSGESAPLVQQA